MVGRLKPNVTPQQAHAELEAIRQNLRRQYPGIYTGKIGLTLVPLTEEIVMNIKSVLLTIFCAAGAVLLVGCVNLAGISLSRAAARQRELAVRTALGATRGQLTRLLLTESFVLAMAGGSLGMLLEVWVRGRCFILSRRICRDREFLNRLDGAPVCGRSDIYRRACVWTGARMAAFPIGPARRTCVERPRINGRRFAIPAAHMAGVRADRARAGFARERWAAITKLYAAEHRKTRVRLHRCADDSLFVAANRI